MDINIGFNIFGRYFICPFMIRIHGPVSGGSTSYPVEIYIGKLWLVGPSILKSGGTCDYTEWLFRYGNDKKSFQWSFIWRPDITWYNWNKETYFKNRYDKPTVK